VREIVYSIWYRILGTWPSKFPFSDSHWAKAKAKASIQRPSHLELKPIERKQQIVDLFCLARSIPFDSIRIDSIRSDAIRFMLVLAVATWNFMPLFGFVHDWLIDLYEWTPDCPLMALLSHGNFGGSLTFFFPY